MRSRSALNLLGTAKPASGAENIPLSSIIYESKKGEGTLKWEQIKIWHDINKRENLTNKTKKHMTAFWPEYGT